jgi:hypothetical protein
MNVPVLQEVSDEPLQQRRLADLPGTPQRVDAVDTEFERDVWQLN